MREGCCTVKMRRGMEGVVKDSCADSPLIDVYLIHSCTMPCSLADHVPSCTPHTSGEHTSCTPHASGAHTPDLHRQALLYFDMI